MSSAVPTKFDLRQKPNSRERIIFFAALFAFGLGFFKTCVMASNSAVSALQEELDKVNAEHGELSKLATRTPGEVKASEAKKVDQSAKWIGKKESIDLAIDDLVKAAKEDGILLLRLALPEFKDKQNYWFKPVSISIAGALADLGHYLERTEQLPVPLVIERLAIEPNTDFAGIITLRLEGGFYATK